MSVQTPAQDKPAKWHPKTKAGLTKRQRECLDYISGFIAENGFSPSYDEIGIGIDLASKASVSRLVHRLEGRGHISVQRYSHRSITVLSAPENSIGE